MTAYTGQAFGPRVTLPSRVGWACGDRSDRSAPAYQFLVVRLPSEEAAVELARRGVLIMSIFELWGSGRRVTTCSL